MAEQKAFRVPYDIMTEQLRNVIAEDQEKAGGQAAQTEGASAEPEAQNAQTEEAPAEMNGENQSAAETPAAEEATEEEKILTNEE